MTFMRQTLSRTKTNEDEFLICQQAKTAQAQNCYVSTVFKHLSTEIKSWDTFPAERISIDSEETWPQLVLIEVLLSVALPYTLSYSLLKNGTGAKPDRNTNSICWKTN